MSINLIESRSKKGEEKKKQMQKSYATIYEFLNAMIQEIDLNTKKIIK